MNRRKATLLGGCALALGALAIGAAGAGAAASCGGRETGTRAARLRIMGPDYREDTISAGVGISGSLSRNRELRDLRNVRSAPLLPPRRSSLESSPGSSLAISRGSDWNGHTSPTRHYV